MLTTATLTFAALRAVHAPWFPPLSEDTSARLLRVWERGPRVTSSPFLAGVIDAADVMSSSMPPPPSSEEQKAALQTLYGNLNHLMLSSPYLASHPLIAANENVQAHLVVFVRAAVEIYQGFYAFLRAISADRDLRQSVYALPRYRALPLHLPTKVFLNLPPPSFNASVADTVRLQQTAEHAPQTWMLFGLDAALETLTNGQTSTTLENNIMPELVGGLWTPDRGEAEAPLYEDIIMGPIRQAAETSSTTEDEEEGGPAPPLPPGRDGDDEDPALPVQWRSLSPPPPPVPVHRRIEMGVHDTAKLLAAATVAAKQLDALTQKAVIAQELRSTDPLLRPAVAPPTVAELARERKRLQRQRAWFAKRENEVAQALERLAFATDASRADPSNMALRQRVIDCQLEVGLLKSRMPAIEIGREEANYVAEERAKFLRRHHVQVAAAARQAAAAAAAPPPRPPRPPPAPSAKRVKREAEAAEAAEAEADGGTDPHVAYYYRALAELKKIPAYDHIRDVPASNGLFTGPFDIKFGLPYTARQFSDIFDWIRDYGSTMPADDTFEAHIRAQTRAMSYVQYVAEELNGSFNAHCSSPDLEHLDAGTATKDDISARRRRLSAIFNAVNRIFNQLLSLLHVKTTDPFPWPRRGDGPGSVRYDAAKVIYQRKHRTLS